jgi:hypothetical protein
MACDDGDSYAVSLNFYCLCYVVLRVEDWTQGWRASSAKEDYCYEIQKNSILNTLRNRNLLEYSGEDHG